MKPEYTAEFRFYAELNDFLPPEQRKQTMRYRFSGHPGIKDPIEVFGVPHTEVDLIAVNGQSVGFDYQLQAGDRVAVYPVFETLDISSIVKSAVNERRIVLTRDRRLLYIKQIDHGHWVRAVDVEVQVDEVLRRFDLYDSIHPFARCLICNGVLAPVAKADIWDHLEPKTRLYYEDFYQCADCRRIYWQGSHMKNMLQRLIGLNYPAFKRITDVTHCPRKP